MTVTVACALVKCAAVIGIHAAVVALAVAGLIYFAITKYGYHVIPQWPFLTR